MVNETSGDEGCDVREIAAPMTLPARRTKPGGLVARRLELFDSPMRGEKKGYVHRQQDSFHPSSLHPVVEARDEEARDLPDPHQRGEKADSRASSDNYTGTSPSPKLPRNYPGSALIETGVDHYTKGDYELALHAFAGALKTQRDSVHRGDDIFVALTLGNLGAVYLQKGNYVEAERVLQESLDIKKRLAPSMLMADTLNNLGNCANMRGDYLNSCLFYEEALEEIRSKNGPRVDEINALFNIGRLEIQREHWTKAMISLSEACRMAKEHYGSNSEFVAQPLDLMGFVQLSTGKLDAAMVSFTGALAIYRRIHGPMHLEVANSLYNVGMVREAKGDLTDAWEAYTTARDLYARLATDQDHPGYKTVRRNISEVEREVAKQNQKRLVNKHKRSMPGKQT